ncbi:nucleoside hydrolase-like domain-containing protein [Novipirellula artificiosorum]|uniref:Rhamnogalacturonan acetylesterase RhgT n=1 Tax=Novipirellula artificiosorum TaxID=2528016 RepID=A0A5C6D1R6_9BACT|nr:nucleoside hydrolase-like domain-containing protein [Novipirellula artificiosorum]TWU30872.1 Rhamnogalacturonan acetylesterase RhgT [Novipirellula artificiosorum]
MTNTIKFKISLMMIIATLPCAVTTNAVDTGGKLKIVLAGDSTVTDQAGWGLGFANSLTADATCVNLSAGGRSSKSFRDEGRWQKVLDERPAVILIQFGHNDQPGKGPERETDPNTTYRRNLARYVDESRAIGAKPVIVTSISRRLWASDGIHINSILTGYVKAAKTVADEKKVPVIDLHAQSIEIYEALGQEGCERISPRNQDGSIDRTHLNALGGERFGALIANDLARVMPELKNSIRDMELPNSPHDWLSWLNVLQADDAAKEKLTGGALTGKRPRVVVSTDIGGSDPDDFQSMVHLLFYADVLDIEGLISSPPNQGRLRHLHEALDAYESDFEKLKRNSGKPFPTPKQLRNVSVQGAVDTAPKKGWSNPTDGSRLIIQAAQSDDERPLWILVWGSITDVAQAVHDQPAMKSRIRVYSIGSWNTQHDQAARDYLFENHPDLWWIESDTTFRGMYVGGEQQGEWSNLAFVERHVRHHGALGDLFYQKKRDIKMGDSPSLLYILQGNPDDPTSDHWGGAYQRTDHGQNYWTDDPNPELSVNRRPGAISVNRWRRDFLADWQARMDYARDTQASRKN